MTTMLLKDPRRPPQALSLNKFSPGTLAHSAFEQCLILERQDSWGLLALNKAFSESIMAEMSPKTVARVLGHALTYAPNSDGLDVLAREIMSCKLPSDLDKQICDPELLAGLAHLYVYGLIRVFYNPKGPTPCISVEQSPRRSFEQAVNEGSSLLQTSLTTTPTLRNHVMCRDENRCVFTGHFDGKTYMSMELANRVKGIPLAVTQTAHIISQSLTSGIFGLTTAATTRFAWASSAAAVIEYFGGFSAYAILGGDNLNSPANAFTAGQLHGMFDSLDIWLVPAKDSQGFFIPDAYDVESVEFEAYTGFGGRARVSFRQITSDDGTVIPPPSPQILALHAACASVAHLSAAMGHLHDMFGEPDPDDTSVMTQPAAAATLTHKLNALKVTSSTA